jgi:hypothetical protein
VVECERFSRFPSGRDAAAVVAGGDGGEAVARKEATSAWSAGASVRANSSGSMPSGPIASTRMSVDGSGVQMTVLGDAR